MKNDILLIIKLPPPITGATLMNQRLNNSKYIRRKYNIRTIAASYSKSVSDMGRINFYKILCFSKVFNKLLINLIVFNPDLVYFQISPLNGPFIRDSLLVLLLKIFRKRIVFHIRGKGIQNNIAHNSILRYYYEFIFRNTDVICLSELLTYDIEPFKINKIHILNNGLPDINVEWIKKSKLQENKVKQLIFLSNLIISKGILDFIDSLEILNNNNISFKAVIVGANGTISSQELVTIIKEKKLNDKVMYLGSKYGDDKYQVLAESDILVFPSKNDAFPGVVVEGMQFGLPVVSTEEGSIPLMVDDGVTGFVVERGNPKQLAEKLEVLLKNEDLIKKMGINGRKKYQEKYTFKKYEKNIEIVFNDILK